MLALVAILLIAQSGVSSGWYLALLSLWVTLHESQKEHHLAVQAALILIVLVHHMMAVVNSYYAPLEGASLDALSFHEYASHRDWSSLQMAIGYNLFLNFIVIAYQLGGDSLFLGNSLSVFAFTLSLLIFHQLVKTTGPLQRIGLLALFGLLPHVLVYTSVTLRESWQLLFFISALYCGLNYRQTGRISVGILGLFSLMALAVLHQVLVVLSALAVIIIAFWPIRGMPWKPVIRFGLVLLLGLGCFFILLWTRGVSIGLLGFEVVSEVLSQDFSSLGERLGNYRHDVNTSAPRTAFSVNLDLTSLAGLLQTLPIVTFHYLFEPFPWSADLRLKDYVLVLINILRFIGLLVCLGYLLRRPSDQMMWLILILYLLMCGAWIFGSTNYGQASRHHVLSDWLIWLGMAVAISKSSLLSSLRHHHKQYIPTRKI